MKSKQNWKRFWTLNRHHAEGFTLVELIVVIAVLAILGGVAVPAYSGYITRANKQADISLVSEIAHALTLQYYADPNNAAEDYVVLSATEEAKVGGEFATAAMVAVFGENWKETAKLKYDGWSAQASNVAEAYKNSSLNGKVNELLTTTTTMTQNLAAFLEGRNKPAQIEAVMNKYGYTDTSDTTAFANAAVLALAEDFSTRTNAEGVTMQSAVADALASGAAGINNLGNTVGEFYGADADEQDMSRLATAAALYAYATAFSEYAAGNESTAAQTELDALNNTLANSADMSSTEILQAVMGSFGNIAVAYNGSDLYNNYFADGGQGRTDADALMAVMGGITESADALGSNLGSANCYADASGLVNRYLALGEHLGNGYIAGVIIDANGGVSTYLGEVD